MPLSRRLRGTLAVAMLASSMAVVTTDFAEAQRRGSFGSRGSRTYSAPAPTQTAPNAGAPLQRSMTPQAGPTATAPGARAPAAAQQNRGGMFGGLAGGLIGGLMLGGLVGMLMGGGLGGFAGFLGLIVQVALIAGIAFLVMRLLRGRRSAQQPAYAGGPDPRANAEDDVDTSRAAYTPAAANVPLGGGDRGAPLGGGNRGAPLGSGGAVAAQQPTGGDELGLDGTDFDAFEQLLAEVKAAFAREDFARLRTLCTPEIVSYLSEEISENAVKGVRNDISDVRLLQGDLSEAWQDGKEEYATVAMRFESVDVMRDRQTEQVVEGTSLPSETTQLWTFVRPAGGAWKLSAIQ